MIACTPSSDSCIWSDGDGRIELPSGNRDKIADHADVRIQRLGRGAASTAQAHGSGRDAFRGAAGTTFAASAEVAPDVAAGA